jgi:hypothetical protein
MRSMAGLAAEPRRRAWCSGTFERLSGGMHQGVAVEVDEAADHAVRAIVDNTTIVAGENERRFSDGTRRAGDFLNAKRKEHPGRDSRDVPKRHVEEALTVARDGGEAGIGPDQRF